MEILVIQIIVSKYSKDLKDKILIYKIIQLLFFLEELVLKQKLIKMLKNSKNFRDKNKLKKKYKLYKDLVLIN